MNSAAARPKAGNGGVFETEPYCQPIERNFHERFMKGERLRAVWVNDSDFEIQGN